MSVNQKDLIRRSKLLAGIYEASKRKIVAELLSFETFTNIEKRRIIKEVDNLLRDLVRRSDAWYQSHLKTAYKEGSSDVVGYLKALGVKDMTFTASDWETISMMVDQSQKFTYEAISGIKRNTSRVLDDLTIKRVQGIIAEGKFDQKTLRELKGDLLDFMQKKGVTIKDSAGRNWQLDKYAEMLARTDMMNSYNQGVANQILHKGGDLAQITSYPTCECDVCLAWEGKIVSITGRTAGYPSLDRAYEDGVFHPNCKHDLKPVLEEFEQKEDNMTNFTEHHFTKPKELQEHILMNYAGKASESEVEGLDMYIGSGAFKVNSYLRTGDEYYNSENTQKIKDSLDSLLSRSRTAENLKVFRGFGDVNIADLEIGAEILDKGYVSTTLNRAKAVSFADDFGDMKAVAEISVPEGSKGFFTLQYTMKGFSSEQELLLNRNSKLKVIGKEMVKKSDGIAENYLLVKMILL